MARLREADILEGGVHTEGAQLQILVNRAGQGDAAQASVTEGAQA